MTQRIAVAGSSGLLGGALCRSLVDDGHEVVRLVRRAPTDRTEVAWDPASRHLDPAVLEDIDAIVNLGGEGLGRRRWNPEVKADLIRSRTDGTTTLAEAVASAKRDIHLVNASAVGYYGDRGDEVLTEESIGGSGFLAELTRAWEGATEPARAAGKPVTCLRTGIVLAPDSDALDKLLPLTKLGLGGPLGSGRQFWAWITLDDHVRAVRHVIDHRLEGPVNLTGPEPARQREVVAEMGRQLHRPTGLPAPAVALRLVVGELAGEILTSQRALPTRLLDSGFEHRQATLPEAVSWLLER